MPTTNARAVAWLTAVMMVVEIVAGRWYNSMALLADGFHMSSHALAWDESGDELNVRFDGFQRPHRSTPIGPLRVELGR